MVPFRRNNCDEGFVLTQDEGRSRPLWNADLQSKRVFRTHRVAADDVKARRTFDGGGTEAAL